MANDSGSDYNKGLTGQGAENVTDRDAYAAGQGARLAGEASQDIIDGKPGRGRGFFTPPENYGLNAQGFALLMYLPILPVIYPTGGALVAAGYVFGGVLAALFDASGDTTATIRLFTVGAAIPFFFKAERFANDFAAYRWLRHVIRGVLLGAIIILMILSNGVFWTWADLGYAWDQASPRQVFYCYAAFPIAILISLFGDYFLFQGVGISAEAQAKDAARRDRVDSGEEAALIHITFPKALGFITVMILATYILPFHLLESFAICLSGAIGWALYRRRRRRLGDGDARR